MEPSTVPGVSDGSLSNAADWPPARIRALGSVTDIPTAAQIFGIGRSTAYDLVQLGQFPVPALKVGRRYRVPVAAILAALNIPAAGDEEHPSTDLINPRPPSVDQRREIRSPTTRAAPRPTVLEDS